MGARHKGVTANLDRSDQVKKILKVLVEPRRGNCQPGQYQCEGKEKYCIATRHRCDGQNDCPAGDDESELFCGPNPCKGKLTCPDLNFRCIDPTEYCCNPDTNPNCQFTYACCEAILEYSLQRQLGHQLEKKQQQLTNDSKQDCRESDLAYLHSTVYTILGCAIDLIVIVIALGVAIGWLHILLKSYHNAVVKGACNEKSPSS